MRAERAHRPLQQVTRAEQPDEGEKVSPLWKDKPEWRRIALAARFAGIESYRLERIHCSDALAGIRQRLRIPHAAHVTRPKIGRLFVDEENEPDAPERACLDTA